MLREDCEDNPDLVEAIVSHNERVDLLARSCPRLSQVKSQKRPGTSNLFRSHTDTF